MNAELIATLAAARARLAEYAGWTKLSLARSRETVRLTRILIVETRKLILLLDDIQARKADRRAGSSAIRPFSPYRSGKGRNNSVKLALRP